MKYILLCIALFCGGVIIGLYLGVQYAFNWFTRHYGNFIPNELKEIAQWDTDNPNSLVPYLGPYEKYEHANILVHQFPHETKSACYDFSRWETHKVIGVIVTAPEFEEEAIGIVPDKTVYKFEGGLSYWL